MRKISKRYLPLLLSLVLMLGMGVLVQASTKSRVVDAADILSNSSELELTSMVEELELSSGWEIMVVSIADAEGKTAQRYAEEWFGQYAENDDGVICFIDMDNREMVIPTFGEAIEYLPDDRIEAILDEAYYGASEGDYFAAFESMLEGVADALQRGIPSDQYTYDEETGEVISQYIKKKGLTIPEILIAVAAALAAGGITIGVIVGKYRLKWGDYQYSCRENGTVRLSKETDMFVNQIVTHRRIPRNNTSASGGVRRSGSRSTTHRGAGGRRSGGGSRKF